LARCFDAPTIRLLTAVHIAAMEAIVFVDALPETVGGKVLKYKLRHQLAGTYR
jgi:acyl-coenzyme A synthetase/AMP-(fatty) acid ligase